MIANFCLAQSMQLPQNIQAPTTSSLGKYGDVPVSLYNGSANVNIPLMKLEEKGIEMDISLSYDASGVAVAGVPSWVGQNWALNAGGVITRQVNGGAPDDFEILNTPYFLRAVGFIHPYSRDRLNNSNWASTSSLENIDVSNRGLTSVNPQIGKDSEPDIFTFNFMGHNGKFFMGEDGLWRVASDENFTVEISNLDYVSPFNIVYNELGYRVSKTIGKIVLKDDKGNKYTFGASGTWNVNMPIEFSKDFFKQSNVYGYPDSWTASAWYLAKVENSSGITVFNLEYVRENGYTGAFYNYQSQTSYLANYIGPLAADCSGGYGSGYGANGQNAVGGQLISPVYLSKIKTPISKIDLSFLTSDSSALYYHSNTNSSVNDVWSYLTNFMNNALDNSDKLRFFKDLMPYANTTEIMNKLKYRKLDLIAGYKGGVAFSYTSIESQRLKLNQVTLNNSDTHSFEYDRFEELPHLTSKAVDHLGYYRGSPYSTTNNTNHFNERSTNSDKVLIGSLQKIIYPTKGYTQFEYEPHTYSQYVSDNKMSLVPVSNSIVGGLRIKKIITKDSNNIIKTKSYKYVKGYDQNANSTNSSGIINCLPKYHWVDWTTQSTPGSTSGTLHINQFSNNPIIPMGNFFGSPIGYSEVVEIDEFINTSNNPPTVENKGYTIYKYTSNEHYRDEPLVTTLQYNPSPYQKFCDKSMLRGKLLEINMYNTINEVVNKKSFTYLDPNTLTTKFVKGVNVSSFACPGSPGNGFILGGAYKIYYFDFKSVRDSETYVFNGNNVKTDNIYDYTSYPQASNLPYDIFLKSKTTETYLTSGQLGSENVQERFSYAFEDNTPINNSLVLKRVFVPIKKEILKNNVKLSTETIEYGNITPFSIPLPIKTFKSKGDNPLEENVIIDSYENGTGNITQYHTKNGIYTILAWGYDKRFPIVKMVGLQSNSSFLYTKVSQINTLLATTYPPYCDTCFLNIIPHLNEIRNNYPNHLVTTYTYHPALDVITSITDPKGDTQTFYYYGSLKLRYVKDQNGNILSENQYNYRPN